MNGKGKSFTAFLFAVVTLFLAVGVVHAQHKEQTPEAVVEKMKADLNLTDDQAAKILPIITEDMKKRKDLWEQAKEQGHDSREAIKEQMEKLNQERDTKLAKYLNADQVTKLKQKREERKAGKHGHNHGGNRGGGHSGNDQGSGGE